MHLEKKCCACLNRRELVAAGAQTAAAAALVGLGVASLVGCGAQKTLTPPTGTGTTTGSGSGNTSGTKSPTATTTFSPTNGLIAVPFTDASSLKTNGACVLLTLNLASGKVPVYVTRVDASTATTVTTLCTHQGCTIDPYNAKSGFLCPCHSSVFSADGSVVQGPAVTALTAFPTTITQTGIQIKAS